MISGSFKSRGLTWAAQWAEWAGFGCPGSAQSRKISYLNSRSPRFVKSLRPRKVHDLKSFVSGDFFRNAGSVIRPSTVASSIARQFRRHTIGATRWM
jgi:hypothetical protein